MNGSSHPTAVREPDLWSGIGFLFSVSTDARIRNSKSRISGSRLYTTIGGPRARLAVWENRWALPVGENIKSIDEISSGDPDVLELFRLIESHPFSFELDVYWNRKEDEARVPDLLQRFLPPRYSELVLALPPVDALAINENRQIPIDPMFDDLEPRVIDLAINSLPSTRQRTRPMAFGTRWVRILLVKNGIIAFWHENTRDTWREDNVPWPHNGIASRSKKCIENMRSQHVSPQQRQNDWVRDLLKHEEYYIGSWQTEIECWQDAAFSWLTESLTAEHVDELRRDLGTLSQYLTSVRWSQRALLRRSEEAALENCYEETMLQFIESARRIESRLGPARQLLGECFDILSTISQRIQEETAKRANETSERLNWLITLFTAVLFVPTVVAGIYGANIDVLSEGATGTLFELIALMTGFAIFSFGMLNLVTLRWNEAILGTVCGLLVIIVYEIPLRLFNHSPNILLTSLPAFLFLLGIVGIRTRKATTA